MENYIGRRNNMTNTNDQRILDMKKKIAEKKEKLGKITRFTPITNCSIDIEGERVNIQTLSKEKIILLMVKLNAYVLSARDLGVLNNFEMSGYNVKDWITDLKSKLDILSKKDEEKVLKSMENKLSALLSEGKKTELEIDEIESLLKD